MFITFVHALFINENKRADEVSHGVTVLVHSTLNPKFFSQSVKYICILTEQDAFPDDI